MVHARILDKQEKDEDAMELYSELLPGFEKGGEIKHMIEVLCRQCNIHIQHGRIDEAEKSCDKALSKAPEAGDNTLLSELLYEAAQIAIRTGKTDGFADVMKKVKKLDDGHHSSEKQHLCLLLQEEESYISANDSEKYLEYLKRLGRIFSYEKNEDLTAFMFFKQAMVKTLEGSFDEALTVLKEDVLKNEHDVRLAAMGLMLACDIGCLTGKTDNGHFRDIDEGVVKNIPTLYPKYKVLSRISNGSGSISDDLVASFLADVQALRQQLLYEEFPFCLKERLKQGSDELQGQVLACFYGRDKLETFLKTPGV